MGAPEQWVQSLLKKHGDNFETVEKIVLKEKQSLFKEVIRTMNLLMSNHFFNDFQRNSPVSILEVGCGTGNFTLELAKLKRQSKNKIEIVTGDISPTAISITREKLSLADVWSMFRKLI